MIVTLAVIAVSVLCLLIIRKRFGHPLMAKHNDVAGFIYAVVGVIYAVLLAFVVIVEWEMFCDSNSKVQNEVQSLASVFRDIQVFDEPQRSLVQHEILNYTNLVIKEEWPLMAKDQYSEKALASSRRIFNLVTEVRPANDYQKIWYQDLVSRVNSFCDDRNQRLEAGKQSIPLFMWDVMLLGAAITIGFSFLFGTEELWAHSIMMAALSAIVTLVLLLVMALDHPFHGIIMVTPEAFEDQLNRFMTYYAAQPK
ncbi:MAG: DUF4239 domain-containing protein [Chlorobium sp.]